MNSFQRISRLTTILMIILLLEACQPSIPIPTLASTVPPSTSTPPTTETPIPPSPTAAPPTITPTRVTLTPDATLVAALEGLWEGSNGSYYLFKPDGTWHWHEIQGKVENAPENTGTWRIQGDVLYIVDLTGKAKCPQNQVGRYKLSFQDSKLKLLLESDKCEVRVPQTQGIYKPLK